MMGWVIPVVIGTATGILSGFGVGGGTLLLLYLTAVAGVEQQSAQGINLLYFLPVAMAALPAHWKGGYIAKRLLLPAIVAGLIATALGSWVATSLDTQFLHKLFGGFLLVVGVKELFAKPPKSDL